MRTFRLGSVPNQVVYADQTLDFRVTSTLGAEARFSLADTDQAHGTLSVDAATGVFRLVPKAGSSTQFAITLRAQKADTVETQRLRITPLPRLPSDFDIVVNRVVIPEATSESYVHTTNRIAGRKVFNPTSAQSAAIDTRALTISGVTLVFEGNSDVHPLHQSFSGHNDLEAVNLYADTVIVKSPLHLPSSTVTIFARSLVFEGDGCIDTTPVEYATSSNQPVAGHGGHAGHISLHVKTIAAPGRTVRLIAKGGNGQAAMQGIAGVKGTAVTGVWDGRFKRAMFWFDPELNLDWSGKLSALNGYSAIYVEIIKTMGMSSGWSGGPNGHAVPKYEIIEKVDTWGNASVWPGNGSHPKIAPGTPGEPGDGGNVVLPKGLPLDTTLVTLTGGAAGKPADSIAPAKAGTPVKSCHARAYFKPGAGVQTNVDRVELGETHVSSDGDGATAPTATKKQGASGKIEYLSDTADTAWLHPAAAIAFVEYAKDVFLAERPDLVRAELSEYQLALSAARSHDQHSITYTALNVEISGMIRRMDGLYDYFGNPAGWVPMLSFESNLRLYRGEVENSARLLFLSYWIEKNQANKEAMKSGLEVTLRRLNQETRDAVKDYQAAVESLSDANEHYSNTVSDIGSLLTELSTLEATLQKQLKKELQLEHVIRGSAKLLGGVLQMIPAGQPALGAVGSGLSVLADFDPAEPFDTVKTLGSELWGTDLVQKTLMPKVKASAQSFLKLKTDDTAEPTKFDAAKAKKELDDKVKTAIEAEKAVKAQVTSALGSFTVPDDELKEALNRAVADCPEYTAISKKIAALGETKTELAKTLYSIMHVLDVSTDTIMNNELGRIAIREQLSSVLEGLNHEARRYANELGRRARARLIRYQYYMIKSYNYFMLAPQTQVDYRASYMLKEFAKLLGDSKDGTLTDQQFGVIKSVFDDQLSEIVQSVLREFEVNPHPPSITIGASLSPRQIDRLNRDGMLTINLMDMGYLYPTDDNVRIINIVTSSVELLDPPADTAVNVRLEYRHSGISVIRNNGRQFLFRTGDFSLPSGNADQPNRNYRNTKMLWGANIQHDFEGTHKPDQITPSPSSESLLHYLLNRANSKAEQRAAIEYYRPSAWADISIRRTAGPLPYEGHLKRLNFQISYDYQPAADHIYSVFVATPGGAQPIIQCDTADLNHRSHGMGSFLRIYDSKHVSKIALTAPAFFGNRAFMGWKLLSHVRPNPEGGTLPLTPVMTPSGVDTFLDISERFAQNDHSALNNAWMSDLVTANELTLAINQNHSLLAVYLPVLR